MLLSEKCESLRPLSRPKWSQSGKLSVALYATHSSSDFLSNCASWYMVKSYPSRTIVFREEVLITGESESCVSHDFSYVLHACKSKLCCAHYFDTEYTGAQVREELLRYWYRNTAFRFWEHRLEFLAPFLLSDRWDCGIAAKDMVSKIRLEIDASINQSEEKLMEAR